VNNTMFNHYNVKENKKMNKNGDLRTMEMCTDTCSMYPPFLIQGTEKNLTGQINL